MRDAGIIVAGVFCSADDIPLEAVITMGEKDMGPDREPTAYPDRTPDSVDAMRR